MSNKTKKALKTYGYSFLACLGAAVVALHKSPFDYTVEDLKWIGNTVWFAFLPVLVRAVNPKDAAFGVASSPKVTKSN